MMDYERYLFIGGPADGRRISVPASMEVYRVATPGSEIDEFSREIIASNYYRMLVAGPKEQSAIFRFEGISEDDLMKRFISQYMPSELADKLNHAKDNFESADRGLRNQAVPVAVAQAAFDCGMRWLKEAMDLLK